MTKCITLNSVFNKVKNRKIDINFSGGDVTSDGGAILLKEVDYLSGNNLFYFLICNKDVR
jgi:hypothetical protein